MKNVLKRLSLIVIVLLIAGFGAVNVSFGIGPNLGFKFGYYGKLNTVLSEIINTKSVDVVEVGLHKDLTLEDFYITVEHRGQLVKLEFENANIRTIDDLLIELALLN